MLISCRFRALVAPLKLLKKHYCVNAHWTRIQSRSFGRQPECFFFSDSLRSQAYEKANPSSGLATKFNIRLYKELA